MKNVKHIQAAVQSQNHSSTAVNAEELSQQLSILIDLEYFSPGDYLYLLWSFLERQDWNSQKPLKPQQIESSFQLVALRTPG